MSNINRTINLLSYLPNILQNSLEMQTIMETELPEIQALWNECTNCLDDQFISEATEYGIARRENMLDISPYATDTLEDRRLRIYARYNENIPYTRSNLKTLLESLCGENGYTLEIVTREFDVRVTVSLTVKTQAETIRDTMERILPYNMTFSVELKYNKWEQMIEKTWGSLAKISWSCVKEDVID